MREIHESVRNDAGATARRRSRVRRGGRSAGRPPFAALVRAAALALAAASTLAAALALVTSPPAAAHPGPLQRPSGDNCAYAGTTPPVHLPTEFPMPPGWHFPCTKPTHHPPPRPTPKPAPPPPSRSAAPRPHPWHTPADPPAPRPSPPTPPPARPTPPAPPPPSTPPHLLEVPRPAARHDYVPPARHKPHRGRSVVTRMLLVTTPAVVAGVALRPRSRSSSRSAGRSSS